MELYPHRRLWLGLCLVKLSLILQGIRAVEVEDNCLGAFKFSATSELLPG
jgi:hypothetical protein